MIHHGILETPVKGKNDFRKTAEKDAEVNNMHQIKDIYYENSFHIFVAYCRDHNLHTMNDLKQFSFASLKSVKGIGVGKIEKIQKRFDDYFSDEKNNFTSFQRKGKADVFDLIHPSNEVLPIRLFILLGFSNSAVHSIEKLNIATIGDLKHQGNSVLYKNLPGRVYKKVAETIPLLSGEVLQVIAHLNEKLKADHHYDTLLQRAKGKTLQSIGEKTNVTRERIRQIEQIELQRAKILVDCLIAYMQSINKKMRCLNVNKLAKYFKEKEDFAVAKYIIKTVYKNEYLDFCNKLLISGQTKDEVVGRLAGITRKYIKEACNISEKFVLIDEKLLKKRVEYINIQDFINYLMGVGYKKSGDYVYKTGLSYGLLCAIVIREHFPKGFRIHDFEELNKLREIVQREFKGLELPDNNRALGTRISFFLVLCDRGTYTVAENIHIPISLLKDIYQYIMNSENNTLFFNDIFVSMKDRLLRESNVHNRYFLQGVLKYYYEDDFIFERDSITKKGKERKNIRELIGEFIESENKPVHREAIKERFPGATDVVITNAQLANDNILQWEYNFYVHTGYFQIGEQEKRRLQSMLQEIFDAFHGYASEQLFYKKVKAEYPEFIVKNHINNSSNLFYLTSYLFKEEYIFRRPHISNNNSFGELSSKNVIERFLFKNGILRYSEYQEFVSGLKWSIGTTYAVFKELEKEIIRISEDEYFKKSAFRVPEETVERFYAAIAEKMGDKKYLSLSAISDFSGFPDCGYRYNPFLMESILHLNTREEYLLLAPQVEDRRYIKTIAVKKELGIDSFDRLIAYVIQTEGFQGYSQYQLETALSYKGLIGRYIPKELYHSPYIYMENEKFYAVTE